jgi:hypothetical protein
MFLIRHVCLVLSSYRVFHKASLTEESPAFVSLLPSIHKGLFMLHDMNFSFVQKREDSIPYPYESERGDYICSSGRMHQVKLIKKMQCRQVV